LIDLKKINSIYGATGSEKGTISNFIYDNSDTKFDDCSMAWYNELPLNVLVYNTRFQMLNSIVTFLT
jgi:wobble nucleotide-excising tRNase